MRFVAWIAAAALIALPSCDRNEHEAEGGERAAPSQADVAADPFANVTEEELAEGEAPSQPSLELAKAYYEETGSFSKIEILDRDGVAAEIEEKALADLDLSVYGTMKDGARFTVMIQGIESASEGERRDACEAISDLIATEPDSFEAKGPIALVLTNAELSSARQPYAYNRTLMSPDASGECVLP